MKVPIIAALFLLIATNVSFAQEGDETLVVYPTVAAYNQAKQKKEEWRESDNSQSLPTGLYEITLTLPAGTTVSIALDYAGPDDKPKENAKSGEKYNITIEPRKIEGHDVPFLGCRGIYFGDSHGFTKETEIVMHYKKVK